MLLLILRSPSASRAFVAWAQIETPIAANVGAETAAASDTPAASAVFLAAVTESIAASDSPASSAIFSSARAESVAASDTPNGSTGSIQSESVAASDTSNGIWTTIGARVESVAATTAQDGTVPSAGTVRSFVAWAQIQIPQNPTVAEVARAIDAPSATTNPLYRDYVAWAQIELPGPAPGQVSNEIVSASTLQTAIAIYRPVVNESTQAIDSPQGIKRANIVISWSQMLAPEIAPVGRAETIAPSDSPNASRVMIATTNETAAASDRQIIGSTAGFEIANASDLISATGVFGLFRPETVAATSTQSGFPGYLVARAETAGASDTQTAQYIARPTRNESAQSAEIQSAPVIPNVDRFETVLINDNASANFTAVSARSETTATTDLPVAQALWIVATNEQTGTSDLTNFAGVVQLGIFESATSIDLPSVNGIFVAAISEQASSADAPDSGLRPVIAIAESAAASDGPSSTGLFVAAVIDNPVTADAPTAVGNIYPLGVIEFAAVVDGANWFGNVIQNGAAESSSAAEQNAAIVIFATNDFESSAAVDDIAAAGIFNAGRLEIVLAIDSQAPRGQNVVDVVETAIATDIPGFSTFADPQFFFVERLITSRLGIPIVTPEEERLGVPSP